MVVRRFFHKYKKEFGASQEDAVRLYLKLGKSLDEICELMKPVPRASIRGRISEIKKNESKMEDVLGTIPQIES